MIYHIFVSIFQICILLKRNSDVGLEVQTEQKKVECINSEMLSGGKKGQSSMGHSSREGSLWYVHGLLPPSHTREQHTSTCFYSSAHLSKVNIQLLKRGKNAL